MNAWQVYLTSEPRGERRTDWLTAQITKAIYDIACGLSGKPGSPIKDHVLTFSYPEASNGNLGKQLASVFGRFIPKHVKEKLKR